MNAAKPIFEGSQELAAILLRLHAWFGSCEMSHAEVSAAILAVENKRFGGERLVAFLNEGVASLVRCKVLEARDGGAFRLSAKALGFAEQRIGEIEQEIELLAGSLDALAGLEDAAPASGPSETFSVEQVTESFLSEILKRADLPPDLVEQIVATYTTRGRITMADDGSRYSICLQNADPK